MPKVAFHQIAIESSLACGHTVLYCSAPSKGDIVLCVKCDRYETVASPGRSINKSRGVADN